MTRRSARRDYKVNVNWAVALPCGHFVEIRQRHGSNAWEQIGAGETGFDACAV
jgi:hypothetical protein